MDDTSDVLGTDFYFCNFPVWTIIDVKNYKLFGHTGGIVVMESPAINGTLVPIWSDEVMAERFVDECGVSGRAILAIDQGDDLIAILKSHKGTGVTHVGIDCPTRDNPRRETGRYPTIEEVIRSIH